MLSSALIIALLPAAMAAAGSAAEEGAPEAGAAPPAVYLVAARQKPVIAESLRRAGIHLADDILDAPEMLRVTVGASKGSKVCGTYNNVIYALRAEGETVLELKDEGWTGTCLPNVFDALSEQLARALSHRRQSGGDG